MKPKGSRKIKRKSATRKTQVSLKIPTKLTNQLTKRIEVTHKLSIMSNRRDIVTNPTGTVRIYTAI